MKRIRLNDLLKRRTKPTARTEAEKKVVRIRREALANRFLGQMRDAGVPEPVREYLFIEHRRYRADFAWPEYGLEAEVDGGLLGMGRNSGHTSVTGMLRDQERNAEAAIAGWAVIRVSRKTIDNGQAVAWVRRWFEGRRK